MTKITNKVALSIALSMLNANALPVDVEFTREEVAEKLETMIAALDKKSATPKKPAPSKVFGTSENKAQLAQSVFMALEELSCNDFHTIDEIVAQNTDLAVYSAQAMVSLLSLLVKEGRVERGTVKRKAGYKVIG